MFFGKKNRITYCISQVVRFSIAPHIQKWLKAEQNQNEPQTATAGCIPSERKLSQKNGDAHNAISDVTLKPELLSG